MPVLFPCVWPFSSSFLVAVLLCGHDCILKGEAVTPWLHDAIDQLDADVYEDLEGEYLRALTNVELELKRIRSTVKLGEIGQPGLRQGSCR